MTNINDIFWPIVKPYVENADLDKLKTILDYNVGNGKMMRFKFFEHLLSSLSINYDKDLLVLGYAVELLQAGFLIIDDIMDNSEYRRGNVCHYKVRGMLALRDGRYLVSLATEIMRTVDPFIGTDTVYITCIGQALDSMRKSVEDYTFKLYKLICETKTSMYTFYLPLFLGYKCMKIDEPPKLKEFSVLCGYVFQMYDDYLNFFPDESKKTGNDLEEGKLTYFTALMGKEENRNNFESYFKYKIIDDKLLKFIEKSYIVCKKEILIYLNKMKVIASKCNEEFYFIIDILEKHISNLT